MYVSSTNTYKECTNEDKRSTVTRYDTSKNVQIATSHVGLTSASCTCHGLLLSQVTYKKDQLHTEVKIVLKRSYFRLKLSIIARPLSRQTK